MKEMYHFTTVLLWNICEPLYRKHMKQDTKVFMSETVFW